MRRIRRLRRAVGWGVAAALAATLLVVMAIPLELADRVSIAPVAALAFVIVTAVKVARDSIVVTTTRQATAVERRALANQQRTERRFEDQTRWFPQAAAAAATFGGLAYPLPLGGGWALAWDVAGLLAREVAIGRPAIAVELGSGGSSLVIGETMRRIGAGHLYTLDHDPAFADLTRSHVAALGLEAFVTVLDAPLEDRQVGGATFRWYRLPPEIVALPSIDLLVVDGPPQPLDPDGMPRYPALPAFAGQLSSRALVFVDDGRRQAERRMFTRWLEEFPDWRLEVVRTSKGTGLLRRALRPEAGATDGG